jgi:hypothetical protein
LHKTTKQERVPVKKIFLIFIISLCFCIINAAAETKHSKISEISCLCSVGANSISGTEHKITINQARALVWASLTPEALRLPNIQILSTDENSEDISSYADRNHPRFLIFNVIWDGTPDGSVEIGFYAVDIYTGDVFDPTSSCPKYNNKKLDELQKKIRRSLHLTHIKYQKLKTNGPECVE